MGIYLAHRVTGSRCYGTRVNARPHFCGFQGLAWICLTRITFKGVLFSLSFCPPSDELTPSFSRSELMLLCQPLCGWHPGRNGPAQSRRHRRMQAHLSNWIGGILSVFPAETWGLAQCLFRHEPVDTKRIGGGPSAPGFPAQLLGRQGSAGIRTRAKGYEGGTGPTLHPAWGNSQPSSTSPKVPQSSEIPQDSSGFLEGARAGLGQQDWSGLLTFLLQEKFKSKVNRHLGPSEPQCSRPCVPACLPGPFPKEVGSGVATLVPVPPGACCRGPAHCSFPRAAAGNLPPIFNTKQDRPGQALFLQLPSPRDSRSAGPRLLREVCGRAALA